jgi:hypothetical protein
MIANHERVLFFCSMVRQLSGAVGVSRVAQVRPPKLAVYVVAATTTKEVIYCQALGFFQFPHSHVQR